MSKEIFSKKAKLDEKMIKIGWEVFREGENIYEFKNKNSRYINKHLYLEEVSNKMTKKLNSETAVFQYQVINPKGEVSDTQFYLYSENKDYCVIDVGKNSIKVDRSNFYEVETEKYFMELICEFTELRTLVITGNYKYNEYKKEMRFE
jgi:hypothetical protein